MGRNTRELSSKLIKCYLSKDVHDEILQEAEKYSLTASDFLKFTYCVYKQSKEVKQKENKVLASEEKVRLAAIEEAKKNIIETSDLRLAEELVKHHNFICQQVIAGDSSKNVKKKWILVSPYFQKSEQEKKSEAKDLFSDNEELLESDERKYHFHVDNVLLEELE